MKWAAFIFTLAMTVRALGVEEGDGMIITESDYEAMVAVRNSLHDPGHVLKSWYENGMNGACSGKWVGVKCAQGQVIAIQLAAKGLGGQLAQQIGQLSELRKLNFHSNKLQGNIPSSLSFLQNLRGLYLFDNALSGPLPPYGFTSPLLQALDLSKNGLTGSIPTQLSLSTKLFLLHLGYNNLTGTIPPSIGSLPNLRELRLNNNLLQGEIPPQLVQSQKLNTLDLSSNLLHGSIPSNFSHISSLITLNLAYNDLSGSLPLHLQNLQTLQALNVSNNNLTGEVPTELGNITGLATLDLSRNSFNGRLPSSLASLKNLTSFNCAYNNLTGKIPPFFHKFNYSSFIGNVGLCGYNSSLHCAPSPAPSPSISQNSTMEPINAGTRKKRHKFSTLSLIFIIIGSVIVGLLLLCLLYLLLWQCGRLCKSSDEKKSNGNGSKSSQSSVKQTSEVAGKLVLFEGSLKFTADDLLCATAEVLGKSAYGTVYKATLENGGQIAVKRLRDGVVKGQRDVENEMATLGKIRHPNLLALRAYYWGAKDEKLLIYDYMSGGSLGAFLHARGPDTPLNWETRTKIATGAAKGLAFLHDHEKIIHGNLTSSNILLDSQMNAKLSDYGLSRLMTTAANSNVIATMSALGYRAPELTKLRKATTKSDVYSFGIVLLELLTGKAPGETASSEVGMDLPEWVASVVKEEWTNEIFDIELMKGAATPSDDELINTLQLALNCVSLAPSDRPEMAEIVERLEQMKPDHKQTGSPPSSSSSPAI